LALPGKLSARLSGLGQEGPALLRLPLLVAVVDLPVQLVMISLSGNNFDHYFMAALPSLTVLCAFFFWRLASFPERVPATMWAVILALPILLTGAVATAGKTRVSEDRYTRAIAQYVSTNTAPDEGIFYWGNLVPVYLESDRRSPSRFFFTDPLFLDGYTDRAHTEVFLAELRAGPPALIVSGANADRPLPYSADPSGCSSLAEMDAAASLAQAQYDDVEVFIPDGMPDVYAWICANYTADEVRLAGDEGWVKTVFRYTPAR
jgi:hypothetical protein